MNKLTRLIGGSHAGRTFMLDERLPTYRTPVKAKMDTIHCAPGDLVLPISVELELYAITRTNGDFNYGVINALEFHEALDMMWAHYIHSTGDE